MGIAKRLKSTAIHAIMFEVNIDSPLCTGSTRIISERFFQLFIVCVPTCVTGLEVRTSFYTTVNSTNNIANCFPLSPKWACTAIVFHPCKG